MRKFLYYILAFLSLNSLANDTSAIKTTNCHLFEIARSRDSNIIVYDLNTDIMGNIVDNNPVKIYWVKKTENYAIHPLTWIQNSYAYGIQITDIIDTDEFNCHFKFVSYEKRTFHIKKDSQGNYKVFSQSKGSDIEIKQIFVQIEGGSFWFPSISFVKLTGISTETGKKVTETIIP